MYVLALILFAQPSSPTSLLEAGLTVADLKLSGQKLYPKLRDILKPTGELRSDRNPFGRAEGDPDILLVQWSKPQLNPPPLILLYPLAGNVRAQLVPEVSNASFRRIGNQLIGGGYLVSGNSAYAAAVAFEWTRGGWRKTASRDTESEGIEAAGTSFARRTGSDLRVTVRSYDFKGTLNAPHAGPLLHNEMIWKHRSGRFVPGPKRRVENALAAFDDLVFAAEKGDAGSVRRIIPDANLRTRFTRAFAKLEAPRNAVCVDSYILEDENVFGVEGMNQDEAIFCGFRKTPSGWRVVKVGEEADFPRPRRRN